MKNKEHDRWIDDAMKSMEEIERVGANPFLYGKIQHRIGSKVQSGVNGRWMLRIAFMLLVLLLVNVYSYSIFIKNKTPDSSTNGIEGFATDYNLQTVGDNI